MPRRVRGVEHDVRRLDREHAAVDHRVARIDDEVHEHLLELVRVDLHAVEHRLELRMEFDVFPNQTPEHLLHAADGVVEIEDRRLAHLLSAERQQLPRERRRAARGITNLL